MSKKVQEVQYPKNFCLWKRIIEEKNRLQMIGDFPHRERILSGIGLNDSALRESFGISDEKEIVARQNLLWCLVQNKGLRAWIKKVIIDSELPEREDDFLSFFDPKREHNPYWEQVHQFIGLCDQLRTIPEHLGRLVNFLKNSLSLEKAEKEMADNLFEKIENIASIEGIMDFVGSFNLELVEKSAHVCGYYNFSSKLNYWYNWLPEGIWRLIGKFRSIYIDRKIKTITKELVIDLNGAIITDVEIATVKILEKYRVMEKINGRVIVKVFFCYGKGELKVQIYGMEYVNRGYPERFSYNRYGGYSKKVQQQIKEARAEYEKTYHDFHRKMGIAQLLTSIEESNPFFLQETHVCKSRQMDKLYKWPNLREAYQNEFSEIVGALKEHRSFFKDQITSLKDIVFIADAFCATAEIYNLPLCKPEIVAQGHIIAFEEIYPAYLLPKAGKDVKPFKNMPPLNGNVVGMSGVHEGGKTTIGLTLNEIVYLAQSGLLCFGKGVSINVKKALGMIFVPPGSEGSLCAQLLDQIERLLKLVRQSKSCDIFVTIDELGGGTQVSDGQEFGASLIQTLLHYKISTYFNSQITPLFQLLEGKGVICLQVNSNHVISPGIGTGQFKDLMKRKGIDKLLKF